MHYLAVVVPQRGGGWRAYVPDFPGCRADGADADIAVVNAAHMAGGLIIQLHDKGMTMPKARSQQEIRTDDSWAIENRVDWATAVISAVPIGESG
jgi:predicted RNase H-like HicB family nuclease